MRRACHNCIYFAKVHYLGQRPIYWCGLGMVKLKPKGYHKCPFQTPLKTK